MSPHFQRDFLQEQLLNPAMTALTALPSVQGGTELAGGAGRQSVLVVPIAAAGGVLTDGAAASAMGPGEATTPQPRPTAVQAAIDYDVDVAAFAELHGISGKAGELLTVPAPRHRNDLPAKLVLLGVGDEGATSLRRAGAALARATFGAELVRASVVDSLPVELQRAFVDGFLLGGYRQSRAGLAPRPQPMAARLELTGADQHMLEQSAISAEAVWLARSLTNMPSNIKNPQWMAEQSRRLADANGLAITIRDEHQLKAEGFGGIIAVGNGSATPPRLVELTYNPAEPNGETKHIVLVGKGITFDSGGLSLKPREAMVPMKTDMAGAAVVLAVITAAAKLGIKHRVTALLALAENSIGASSYRPSDVVRAYGGTTIEVGNTDAEGRMVLADSLAYAAESLQPNVLVDIATLTGAAAMGLGRRHGALYSNQDQLIEAFEAAAEGTGERVWHMPLVEDYAFALGSPIADLAHIADPKSKIGGGSIIAALFLQHFAAGSAWVHLDIAGPGRSAADEDEIPKGATGYGTRLLLHYLQNLD